VTEADERIVEPRLRSFELIAGVAAAIGWPRGAATGYFRTLPSTA
jgi:hypothetical protein